MCKCHASTTFHWFVLSPPNQPAKMQICAKSGPEMLLKCFRCLVWFMSIIMMDLNTYLSKHSWNTHICSPNTHQNGNPRVSHGSFFWALTWIPGKQLAPIVSRFSYVTLCTHYSTLYWSTIKCDKLILENQCTLSINERRYL